MLNISLKLRHIILHLLQCFYWSGINLDKIVIFGIHFILNQAFPLTEETRGALPSCPKFRKSHPFCQMPPSKNLSLPPILHVPTVPFLIPDRILEKKISLIAFTQTLLSISGAFSGVQSWLIWKNSLELNSLIQYKIVFNRIVPKLSSPLYSSLVKNVSPTSVECPLLLNPFGKPFICSLIYLNKIGFINMQAK